MSSYDSLPVILVSAADEAAASTIISEIIDNEHFDIQQYEDNNSKDRVWRIVNKYYTADVRLHPLIDGHQLLINPNNIEGHVIYLTEDECTAEVATIRAGQADAAGACADVRLVLARTAAAPSALCSWAAAARADLVPLAAPAPAATDGPFPELSGIPRARAALHAHAWRGLRSARHPPSPRGRTSSESSSGGSVEAAAEEEAAVERAERFAAALGALESAAPHAVALHGAERRLAAERLVAEFCRALGHNLDAC